MVANPRFMRKGTSKFWFVPTIASTDLIPTTAEVTAGTAVTPEINEMAGFTFANNPIDTPDMDTTFVSKIPGEDSTEDSSMTFYERKTTNPIKTLLAKGTVGFIVIFPAGLAAAAPAAGDKADVWPVTVASNARTYTAGNEAAKYLVKFSPNAPAADDVVLT